MEAMCSTASGWCSRPALTAAVRPHVPAMIAAALPETRFSHSASIIDPAMLAGRDVGVLGAGVVGLRLGGHRARQRRALGRPLRPPRGAAQDRGARLGEFSGLPRLVLRARRRPALALHAPLLRAAAAADAGNVQPGGRQSAVPARARRAVARASAWKATRSCRRDGGGRFRVRSSAPRHRLRDRPDPPSRACRRRSSTLPSGATATRRRPAQEDAALGRYPYLGRAFEFIERVPGRRLGSAASTSSTTARCRASDRSATASPASNTGRRRSPPALGGACFSKMPIAPRGADGL